MGLVESFKRTFNISGAEITVNLDDEVLSQNDPVSGEVVIVGGKLDQSGKAIALELKEFWTETRYNAATKSTTTVTVYHTHDTVNLAGAFAIKSGSEQRFRFETRLPLNGRISTGSTGWLVEVSLDIPAAVDPRGHVKLDVKPSEEIAAVLETCETILRFEEGTGLPEIAAASIRRRRNHRRTGFQPPGEIHRRLFQSHLQSGPGHGAAGVKSRAIVPAR
jgi:sporulation-control protein spo0M